MSAWLDDQYFTWLYSQVASVKQKHPHKSYWILLRQLYTKEFVWFVPNDDNRAEDGRDLRYEFFDAEGIAEVDRDHAWADLGCSMLEVLLGLSRRLSFEAEGRVDDWFWHLLENIGLDKFTDSSGYDPGEVDEILERIIWRNYRPDGVGGLFPLKEPEDDQRKVELWYQLSAYVIENQ
jgi:hypothetical protein